MAEVADAAAAAVAPPEPSELTVAGVYERGANPSTSASMVMPLGRLQERVGEEGRINSVLVTHEGPAVEGSAGTSGGASTAGPSWVTRTELILPSSPTRSCSRPSGMTMEAEVEGFAPRL
jgi:hypothetical protein